MHCLCLNSAVIDAQHLKRDSLQEKKNEWCKKIRHLAPSVQDVVLGVNVSYLVFEANNSLRDIRKLLFLRQELSGRSKIGRVSSWEQASGLAQQDWSYERRVLEDLGDIESLHLADFTDYQRAHKVQIDSYSRNRFVLAHLPARERRPRVATERRLYLATDYHERGNSTHCRFSSLVPTTIASAQSMAFLLFAPFGSLIADHSNRFYERLKMGHKVEVARGKETHLRANSHDEVYLEFTLQDTELEQINDLRLQMRHLLTFKGFTTSVADLSDNFLNKALHFMRVSRLPLVYGDQWEQTYLQAIIA